MGPGGPKPGFIPHHLPFAGQQYPPAAVPSKRKEGRVVCYLAGVILAILALVAVIVVLTMLVARQEMEKQGEDVGLIPGGGVDNTLEVENIFKDQDFN